MKALQLLAKARSKSLNPGRVRRTLLRSLVLATAWLTAVFPAAEPQTKPASTNSSDPRWTHLPHTDTAFIPRTYPTLADWTERRERLRRQILWSAGLWPMPERTQVEYPAIQRLYALFGATNKVAHVSFNAGHGYNRDMRNAVYPWFAKWLGLALEAGFTEPKYQTEATNDILIFKESVPANAIRDHETLVNKMAEAATRQIADLRPTTAKRLEENRRVLGEGLRLSLDARRFRGDEVEYVRRGETTLAGVRGEAGMFKEKRRGVEIPVWVFRPEGPPSAPADCTLLIDGQGRAKVAENAEGGGQMADFAE